MIERDRAKWSSDSINSTIKRDWAIWCVRTVHVGLGWAAVQVDDE